MLGTGGQLFRHRFTMANGAGTHANGTANESEESGTLKKNKLSSFCLASLSGHWLLLFSCVCV